MDFPWGVWAAKFDPSKLKKIGVLFESDVKIKKIADLACRDLSQCKGRSRYQSSWRGGGMPRTIRGDSSPGLWNRGCYLPCGRQDAILAPSRPSSFFHTFFNAILYRFLLDFALQVGAKIHQKSIKNRSQERLGKLLTFYIEYSSILDRFETRWNLIFELLASTGSKNSRF